MYNKKIYNTIPWRLHDGFTVVKMCSTNEQQGGNQMSTLDNLTPTEAAYLKKAQQDANSLWETRYNHMLACGYDPAEAEWLASFGENIDSAVMTTESDIVDDAYGMINFIRNTDIDTLVVNDPDID